MARARTTGTSASTTTTTTTTTAAALAALAAIAALPLVACSGEPDEAALPNAALLTGLTAIPTPGLEGIGSVRAFAETAATFAVAGERGFALFEEGAPSARATSSAALVGLAEAPSTVAFAEFVAVTSDGRAVAIGADASLTDVTARFGLPSGGVRDVSNLGALGVAFVTKDGYAVAAGGTVRLVAQAGVTALFACGGRLFARADRALYRLDAEARPAFVTPFPAALTGASCDASGRLLAATGAVLYREIGAALAPLLEESGFASIVGTASGSALLRDDQLCLANEAGVACARGAPPLARLFPSRGALPWGVAGGALVRIARVSDAGAGLDAAAAADASTGADADPPREAGPIPDAGPVRDAAPLVDARTDAGVTADEAAWTQTVKPVAERACFGCHGSVGAASVSLTTYASWVTNRNALRTRVITQRNMPPNASSLSAADRAAIGAWLGP